MSKNNDKKRAYYDFYNLAKYTNDYSDEELEDFKYFSKRPFIIVPPNEKILIRRVLSPGRENVRIEGPGRHYLTPGLEEYIRIPNPANSIVIDPHQVSEADKRENFTFIPGLALDNTKGQNDELYIDYKVFVKIADPIQLFYSANVVNNLIKDLVSIIREFVANHTKEEILTDFGKYKIADFDKNNKLDNYKSKCGLEIEAISVNAVNESREVQEARNKVAVERQKIEQAKARKEVKRIETETDIERYKAMAKMYTDMGLSYSDVAFLTGVYMRGDAIKELRDYDKASVFVNMGESLHMDPRLYFARHGEHTGNTNKLIDDPNIIDAEVEEIEEDSNTKKRRR